MSPGGDRLGRALATARSIRTSVGTDVREARLASGLSQRVAAASVRMSHTQLGRIERGELTAVTVEQLSRACAAVGLKLVTRGYPDGDPIRDAAQLALLARFKRLLPPGATWRTEVSLPSAGDLRSWDGVATFSNGRLAVEAESRVRDVQALERKIALKQRDGAIDLVVLLLNDTDANRRTIRTHRDALWTRFPLDGREVLRSIRAGRTPAASGLLFL